MHDIALRFRCPASPLRCYVVSPAEITQAEMMVEYRAGLALNPLFDVVYIDEVSLSYPALQTTCSSAPCADEETEPLFILIRAKGDCPIPLVSAAGVDRIAKEQVRQALGDLFGALEYEPFVDN